MGIKAKRCLFLCLSIITVSVLVGDLLIYLCIFEKSKEFAKNTKGIEKQVLFLLNSFEEKGKESFIKYKDILEIEKKCSAVTGIIQEWSECSTDTPEKEYPPEQYIGLLENRKIYGSWTGVSPGYDRLLGLTIKEGRFFGKEEENEYVCVLTQNLAESLNKKVQDTIKYMGKEFKIIGIVEEKKPFDINVSPQGEGWIYLPIQIKHQLFKSEGSPCGSTYIRSNNIDLAYKQVIKFLESKYGKNGEKFYLTGEYTSSSELKFQKIFWTVILLFIGSIFLLINKKGLSKFLLLTIDKNQYGTRNILIKTCLLTLIGSILGVIFGKDVCNYLMTSPPISIFSIVVSMLLVFGIEIIFVLLTIRKMTLIKS